MRRPSFLLLIAWVICLGYVLRNLPAEAQPMGSLGTPITVYSGTVGASADIATLPLGGARSGICVLKTTAVAGTSPTLDLYLQSVVGGVDDDFCRFTQVTGTSSLVLRFSTTTGTAASAVVAASDRSSGVSAGACRAGNAGSALKVAAVIGGSASPTVTFALTCVLGNG